MNLPQFTEKKDICYWKTHLSFANGKNKYKDDPGKEGIKKK